MKHIVTYTRYSSGNQKESSIEDQQRKCDQFAESSGLSITRRYEDRAKTGKSDFRHDYQRLIDDVKKGDIKLVIVDDLSRLSRNVNACLTIEEFKFFGTTVISVADGIDSKDKKSKLLIAIRTAMNSSFSDDLKQKVHRGQEGNALKGRTTGGRAYGYRPTPHYSATETDPYGNPIIEYGEFTIFEQESKWVQKIFEWAAANKPYKRIATDLNELGVPSATGKGWTASAITSSCNGRTTGILNNKLYIGTKVWNQTEKIYNPTTGQVKKIPRDESEWVVVDMPHLRIVTDELWFKVKARQEARKNATRKKQSESHSNAQIGRSA